MPSLALAVLVVTLTADAQPFGGPRPLGPAHIFERALDLDGDFVLDETEIANAAKNLLRLDTNGDGELSRNEFEMNGPRVGFAPPPIPLPWPWTRTTTA